MSRLNASILDALSALGATTTTKQAADSSTSHPVGSAPDVGGVSKAQMGSFASTNEADAKANAGPQGVDSAGEGANPKSENMHDRANQQELKPTGATEAPPAEIKPKTTVSSGDDGGFNKPTGEVETGDGGEGRISGVGGPKFATDKWTDASKKVANQATEWLKQASAIVPVIDDTNKQAAADEANLVSAEEAAALVEGEKFAKAQIAAVLKQHGVAENAPIAVKRAAIVRAIGEQAAKHANAFVLSRDPETLASVLNGTYKKAEDTSGAMPPSTAGGDAGAGGGAPPMDPAAAGGAPGGAPAGGAGGQDPQQIIQQVLAAAQSGEITPEEAIELLTQLGLPPEVIQQIQAQLAPAGGAGAAAGGAPGGQPGAGAGAGGGEGGNAPAPTESAMAA